MLASDLCAVLAVAHDAGVIHRDLKPANLFVTRAGELKVLDFGIARVRDAAATSATSTGSVFGTPAFMAPEQAGGLVNELGPLTDVWAVGATMYTLLSGRPVHDGQSGRHIAILAATRPAPSLAVVLPDASPELVAIVDRALAFDKVDRWDSATAMRAALNDALANLTDQATSMGAPLSETMLAVAGVQPLTPRTVTLASPGNGIAFLGGTTGQPVSSEPVTQAKAPALPEKAAWGRGTAVEANDVLPGGDDASIRRRRLARRWAVVGAAALTVVLAVVALDGVLAKERAVPSAVQFAPGLPTSVEPIPSTAALEPAVASEQAPAAPTPAAPRPTVSANPRGTKGPPARPHPSAAPASRLNCNPPFTIVDGIQVHKAACP